MNSEKQFDHDQYDESFLRLTKEPDFKDRMVSIRNKYEINCENFTINADVEVEKFAWQTERKFKDFNKDSDGTTWNKYYFFEKDLLEILKDFNILPPYLHKLEYFIFTNHLTHYFENKRDYFNCEYQIVEPENDFHDYVQYRWNDNGNKYVKLFFNEQVSQKNVIAYIRNHWKNISRKLGKSNKKIRRSKNTTNERNALILELNKRTNDYLKHYLNIIINHPEIRAAKDDYKENVISKILKTKEYFTSSKNVLKVISRAK